MSFFRCKPGFAILLFLVACSDGWAQQAASTPDLPTPNWTAQGDAWWAHVQYLASDKLEGRLPGTPGFEAATEYVEGQFKQIGLKPAGNAGFRQTLRLQQERLDLPHSSAVLEGAGKTELAIGKQISLSPHVFGSGPVSAPLVFAGYGLRLPQKHIDDLAGLDLHGKIVVFYNGAPARLQGPLRAYARLPEQRWKVMQAAGALGWIAITPPRPNAPPPPATPAAPRPVNGLCRTRRSMDWPACASTPA